MLPNYQDVIEAAGRPPLWFTEAGVPRYADYHPTLLGVYDEVAGLFLVACQYCQERFEVGAGTPRRSVARIMASDFEEVSLQKFLADWTCGDPPRHACPGGGETMSAVELGVLQAWERVGMAWVRQPLLERALAR